MNNLDKQYTALLQDILDNGHAKPDRTGTGTISVFGRQIRHKMSEGFPLLTTKKMYMKGIITELIWFLRGDTNIKYLVDNDCHIWDGDCYANYLKKRTTANKDNVREPHTLSNGMTGQISRPFTKEEFINKIKTDDEFAKKWSDLGKIYGFQWRSWGSEEILVEKSFGDDEGFGYKRKVKEQTKGIDQIANLINDLKTNPDSRRLMVNAWNVGELDLMVLPPCHYSWQVYTRELSLEERKQIFEDKGYVCDLWPFNGDWHGEYDGFGIPRRAISLMWNQRSCDVPLGIPFNIASYGLLLEIIAKEVNMVPDELIGNLGDCHIYSNQIDGVIEQIGRPYTLEERTEMLKNAMGESEYKNAISHIAAFNGGLTKYYETYSIPKRTREPYPLPTLKIESEIVKWAEGDCLPTYSISDFTLENYQSHPTIKFPLSN